MTYYRDGNDELQRFEGPSLDEPESPDYVPQLSPEAEAVLERWSFYAIHTNEQSATVHGSEGDDLFRVSKTINEHDLQTLCRLHKNRFEEGFARGRIAMQTQFRELLGAAAVPVDSDY